MIQKDGYWIWAKGDETQQMTPHFGSHEFECQCRYPDCIEQRIAVVLVDKLEQLHTDYGSWVRINSGFRCKKHQADLLNSKTVETVPNSTHTLGHAADLGADELSRLHSLCPKYFQAIGYGARILHVDLRDDKIRRWSYK